MSYLTDKELEGKIFRRILSYNNKTPCHTYDYRKKNKCYQDFDITWPYRSGMFYDNIANGSFTGIYQGCSFTAKDADGALLKNAIKT